MTRKLQRTLVVFFWSAFVLIVVTVPLPVSLYEEAFTWYDKGIHAVLFGFLAFLLFQVWALEKKLPFRHMAYYVFIFCAGFAHFSEYLQLYIPGRSSSDLDTLAGIAGILLTIWYMYIMTHPPRARLLLHICCAGCGVFVSKELQERYKVYLYFFNPNIFPESEYDKRMEEIDIIARRAHIPKSRIFIGSRDRQTWQKMIQGREKDPEKGRRCLLCYEYRLKELAGLAHKKRIKYITTTLTTSPHKDAEAINRIGKGIAYSHNLEWLAADFKKNDGFKRSARLSRDLGLYRQDYCGCEFSIKKKNKRNK